MLGRVSLDKVVKGRSHTLLTAPTAGRWSDQANSDLQLGTRDLDLDDASCSKAGGHSQQGAVGNWSSQTSEVRPTSR